MFQSFTQQTSPETVACRLSSLRAVMAAEAIDYYLVPHADEHQNEYLPARAERLAYMTSFTGSAGFAIIGKEQAWLFVDGRYTVQAAQQTDTKLIKIVDLVSAPPADFLANQLANASARIGFDPWLITMAQKANWEKLANKHKSTLISMDNLVDRIWQNQPPAPSKPAFLHPVKFAGQTADQKISSIKQQLKNEGAEILVLTDPASIAWAFNLRGSDLVHNPLVLAFAIVKADNSKPLLFIDPLKLSPKVKTTLDKISKIQPPDEFQNSVKALAKDKTVHCDPNLVAAAIADWIIGSGGTILKHRDPVVALRAVKNSVELTGARAAHIRDGVAMVRFLSWLDAQTIQHVDEISAAQMLEECRRTTAKEMGSQLREISFDTISGSGPNGAIVHYRVNQASNRKLKNNSLYLVDSGGQYADGTTDITRTIAIGTPPKQAITDNTLVLKGHIAIATACFPHGTRGVDIDALARMALWQHGKDYAHGTGHGIGSYLNVHEGPQSISRRGIEAFLPGMIISNEPGYYRESKYGIRIENLVIVNQANAINDGDHPMMSFETITLCPIDYRLIDPAMLTKAELKWLNDYHSKVRKTLAPYLHGKILVWLKQATRKI